MLLRVLLSESPGRRRGKEPDPLCCAVVVICRDIYTCLINPASLPYCVLGRPLAVPSAPPNLCSNPEGKPGAFGYGLALEATGASSGNA